METCVQGLKRETIPINISKALQVFDYCVHSGSENVVRWGKENLYVVKSLREFQHIDDEGIDQGANSIHSPLHCQG